MKGYKIKECEISGLHLSLLILNLEDGKTLNKYLELFELCFGKRPNIDASLFRWLNNKYPYCKNLNFAFVENATGKIIAAYGLQPGDAFVEGVIKKYALCTNVMSHPDYGGKGLFVAIGKEALDYALKLGISFCFGVPNEKAVSGHLKVGWNVVNDILFYERDFSTGEKFTSVADITSDLFLEMTDADLFSFYNDKYDFYFMRTSSWAHWRCAKPHSKYSNFAINNGSDKGFVVLKEYYDGAKDIKKLHIVDFGYNNSQCLGKLINHCCWFAQQNKFDLLNLWHYSFNEMETKLLQEKGIHLTEQKNPIIIHKLGKDMDIPKSNWHVTLFDNDVY